MNIEILAYPRVYPPPGLKSLSRRFSEHECYCTGSSEFCPADVFKVDGVPCKVGPGPGGSLDSGPASDPSVLSTVLYVIIFLVILLVAGGLTYYHRRRVCLQSPEAELPQPGEPDQAPDHPDGGEPRLVQPGLLLPPSLLPPLPRDAGPAGRQSRHQDRGQALEGDQAGESEQSAES